MLILKTAPVGIDIPIQKAQAKLFNNWAKTLEYTAYGRCYRNKKGSGYIAEVFAGGTEYKEVFLDDTVAAMSFFGVSEKIDQDARGIAMVHLVVFANLAKLKPSIGHRADEEVRQEVRKVLGIGSFGLSFVSVETGIDNVLREYPGTRRDDLLKAADMHPWHCFRLNYKLIFDPMGITC